MEGAGESEMLSTIDLSPLIGTEIRVDRETLLKGSAAAEIRRLLEARGVLVFREIKLSDDEQIAFTRTLGEPANQAGKGLLYKITLDAKENSMAEYLKGTFYWHIDSTTSDIPARASLLSARRLSPVGGETDWANTYAAYDELPESEKKAIENLRVVHDQESAQRMTSPEPTYAELKGWHKFPSKTHPLVWRHKSGRKSLVLGATAFFVEGMSLRDSSELLCRLREWATQPRFVYRHKWSMGDLVIWDNTGTMHRVTPYLPDSGRMMHRTELVGEERLA
jgi:alpha-ketoglutarate-dependent taurine dioxygenase